MCPCPVLKNDISNKQILFIVSFLGKASYFHMFSSTMTMILNTIYNMLHYPVIDILVVFRYLIQLGMLLKILTGDRTVVVGVIINKIN